MSERVPSVDEVGFLQAVEAAKTMCAIGLAISGSVEVDCHVTFEAESAVAS